MTASTKNSLYKTLKASTTIPANWDYVNPETLFNTLNESGVLTNDYKYKVFCAFLEVRCFDDFEERVKLTANVGTTTSIFGVASTGKTTERNARLLRIPNPGRNNRLYRPRTLRQILWRRILTRIQRWTYRITIKGEKL